MIRTTLAVVGLLLVGGIASAQSGLSSFGNSSPIEGATSGVRIPAPLPAFGASTGTVRHRDFTGRPCLDVGGYAQPHRIDPNLYDHIITAVNHCPQRIAIQVCYYDSQECVPIDIPGGEQKEAVLGTMPAEKDFRFEFREKF